ncbi:hypothetical protein [Paraglaciecola arctica]|uniref:hypothetical protein n=1 Tax=Paraglaciecola arctica TaxID=1128911 RepID=UPI001C070954|nr:hypothetical protein [Paraglaciecola arctica]MBU3005302.1 hypothetical protein [Paraglaciecola arctica]
MMKGIESNFANDVNQQANLEKSNDDANVFADSLSYFRDLLSDLNPFAEEPANLNADKAPKTEDAESLKDKVPLKLSVFPDDALDMVEEVSRSVFQPDSQGTQKLEFDLGDISSLQQVLADSLKASLLSDKASSNIGTASLQTNSSNFSLLETAASNFLASASGANLGINGNVIEDVRGVMNHEPILSDIYKNTIETKDKVEQQIDLFSSVTNGLLIGGPAGAVFAITDAVTHEVTGNTLFENFFEFGKETFNHFLGGITSK